MGNNVFLTYSRVVQEVQTLVEDKLMDRTLVNPVAVHLGKMLTVGVGVHAHHLLTVNALTARNVSLVLQYVLTGLFKNRLSLRLMNVEVILNVH